jgi:hypothetical protein
MLLQLILIHNPKLDLQLRMLVQSKLIHNATLDVLSINGYSKHLVWHYVLVWTELK